MVHMITMRTKILFYFFYFLHSLFALSWLNAFQFRLPLPLPPQLVLLSSGRRRTNKNNNKSQLYDVVPVARDISVLPGPDEATKNAITLIDESTTTAATSTSITATQCNNIGEGEEEKQEAQAKIDIATNIFFNEAERDANRLNYPK